MKATIHLVFLLILFAGLERSGICLAQTVATGHVTAEVIESISATSQSVTSLAINTTISNDLQATGSKLHAYSVTDPAVMTLNSGNRFTVNIVLKSENVNLIRQTNSPAGTSSKNIEQDHNPKSNSTQPQSITGTTNLSDSLLSGQYCGSYTVVFACN